ncbi:hypothetical protein [Aquimarina aggregata]|uniref:hypothetical protein n=1 Tax=Aquimarina aggregata TaxID=1642818 RepID=UPI0031F03EFE
MYNNFRKLLKRKYYEFGDLLYQSNNGLNNNYKVSCEELDFLVATMKENSNILGARMMGSGFGAYTTNPILENEYKTFKKKFLESSINLQEYSHECFNILTNEWILVSPHMSKRHWQG